MTVVLSNVSTQLGNGNPEYAEYCTGTIESKEVSRLYALAYAMFTNAMEQITLARIYYLQLYNSSRY